METITQPIVKQKIGLGPKFYLLYSDKQQSKLLTSAKSIDEIKSETEFYNSGVWFEYDTVSGSNLIINEKIVKGINFPETPKERYPQQADQSKNNFKWIS